MLGFLDGLKDIVIIIAALSTIAVLALLAMLVLQVMDLIKRVKADTKPLIEETQKTVQSVRGASTFIGDELVKPLITAVGTINGARRALQVLGDMRSLTSRVQRKRRTVVVAQTGDGIIEERSA